MFCVLLQSLSFALGYIRHEKGKKRWWWTVVPKALLPCDLAMYKKSMFAQPVVVCLKGSGAGCFTKIVFSIPSFEKAFLILSMTF